MVGFELVDQTIPLEVTADPPSELILPNEVAVVVVIEFAEVVLTIGRPVDVLVVKVISFPYPVPTLLVA